MNTILLLVIFVLTIIFIIKNNDNDRIRKINSKIPGPIGLPFVGNLLSLGGEKFHLKFKEWYETYGTVYAIRMGKIPTVVITEYPTFKKTFIDNSEAFSSRYQLPSRIQANGGVDIAMENGAKHASLKRVILSELTPNKIRKMETHITQECEKLIKLLDQHAADGKQFCFNGYLSMFSLNIILRFLFGIDFPYKQVDQSSTLIKAVKDFALSVGHPILSDFLPYMKQPKTNVYMEKLAILNTIIDEMIVKYQKQTGKDSQQEDDSILGKLVNEFNQGKISWESISNTCIDLVLAGSDTSANTIAFALIEMINNQDIQSKLYNSIQITVKQQQDNDGATIDDDIKVVKYTKYKSQLNYLTMIINETLRKHPPAPLSLPHMLTQDVIIDGIEIAAGTQIIQNIYATHRNEKVYTSPNEFIPERFLDQKAASALLHFGCGQRDCVGKSLATCEIAQCLATLINRYHFSNPSPSFPLNDEGKVGLALLPVDTFIIIKRR